MAIDEKRKLEEERDGNRRLVTAFKEQLAALPTGGPEYAEKATVLRSRIKRLQEQIEHLNRRIQALG